MQRNPFANIDRQPVDGLPPVPSALVPREPTPAMLKAASLLTSADARTTWIQMFDAALRHS